MLIAMLILAGCTAGEERPSPAGAGSEPPPRVAPPAPLLVRPEAEAQRQEAPAPVVTLPPAVEQGQLALLTLESPFLRRAVLQVKGLEHPVSLEPAGPGRFVALLAFAPWHPPGEVQVEVAWGDGTWRGAVAVRAKRYPEERLTIREETVALLSDPRVPEQRRRLAEARSVSGPARWARTWVLPVDAPVTGGGDFGYTRYVNGRLSDIHNGVDLAGAEGDPVRAPNAGVVAVAGEFVVQGGTVIIDHGAGLFSSMYHLSRIEVKEGEAVSTGQVVGRVGSTGYATGPHLHWGLSVHNTYIDPMKVVGATLGER